MGFFCGSRCYKVLDPHLCDIKDVYLCRLLCRIVIVSVKPIRIVQYNLILYHPHIYKNISWPRFFDILLGSDSLVVIASP